ncbi:protocadherin Fat 4-like [Mercenaria mercenaria]|uniref:protocadherin Fat 4-like n=1 Tax=Mercenaria mercenaria TaxID=6596 RepID=UPI00234F7233|nr:protocadherin Fat 4-like [Mercenaria mercenaria]
MKCFLTMRVAAVTYVSSLKDMLKMIFVLLLLLHVTTCMQATARVKCGNVTTEDPCACGEQLQFITINDSVPQGSAIAVFNSSTLPTPASACSKFNITADGRLILLADLRNPCTSSENCEIHCGDDIKDIKVIVNNIDEHPPVFPNSSFTTEIFENVTVSATVFDFGMPEYRPKDEDCPDVKSMNYFINKSSDGQEYFGISGGSSGKILLKKSIDYDKLTEHEFNITIGVTSSVQGRPGSPGYTYVIVKILDVDDNDPEFEHLQYKLNVTEETISTTPLTGVPPIRGYDRDKGVNQTILYSFEDYRNISDFLQINTTDGTFSVVKTVDREKNSTYAMTIWCFQSDNHEKKASATVFINVLDINDHLPIFTPESYNVTLVENAVGYVTTVTATDQDIGENAAVFYEMTDSGAFEINSSSGEVRVKTPADLNREKSAFITVLVKARNIEGNYSSSTATVIITLLDVNDNSPEFQEEFYIFYVNSTDGVDKVGQVRANDADEDGSANANVTYEIYPSSVTLPFVIDKSTGILTVQGMFDYEKDYQFLVMACDNPEDENHRRCSMANIEVLYGKNVSFVTYSLEFTVVETLPVGSIFGQKLPVSGNKYVCSTEDFHVDVHSRMMKTNTSLDREADDTYHIYIEVSQYNRLKGNLSVTITIEDVNDNAPRFTQEEFFFSITENINKNTYLGTLNATDKDIRENSNLTFSFQQTFFELFTIDSVSGDVMTSDRWDESMVSKHSLYHLIAVVEDNGEPSLTSAVPVYVSSMKIGQNSSVGIPTSLSKAAIMKDDIKLSLEKQFVKILGFDTVQITDVSDSISHMFVKAYMNGTEVRPTKLQRSLVNNWSPVQNLFRQYMVPLTEVERSENGLSAAEIALIAIAVTLFFAGLVAIAVICKQWDMHEKNNRLRRPSTLYDSQELRMDFAEEELPSRFSTFKGARKESEVSLEGSFGLGYVNAAFNCDGDDINTPRTPTWSCNDTPRIPRWSTSDSLKDAMASLEELTHRLNTEDNISRVSNISRSRRSQKSDKSELQTPRSNQAPNNTEARAMPTYENLVVDPSSRKAEVLTGSGSLNSCGHYDNEISESEKMKGIIESNQRTHDYENVEIVGPDINGDIIEEECTAF